MSYKLALSGVACLTKSTILRKLEARKDFCVHMLDYKELYDKFNFDLRVGPLLATAYRCTHDRATATGGEYDRIHIFDRLPTESVVYGAIAQGLSEEDSRRVYEKCLEMNLHENWRSVVLMAAPDTESLVTEKMKRRANGIDCMNEQYVLAQNKHFKIWHETMNAPAVEIDWRSDMEAQQTKVINLIHDLVYRWETRENDVLVYYHLLPILKKRYVVCDKRDCAARLRRAIDQGSTVVLRWPAGADLETAKREMVEACKVPLVAVIARDSKWLHSASFEDYIVERVLNNALL
ncbi:ORF117 [Lymantria xylina nucleopolyhedrovirus]|uniref:ORF117 n=1 Tax=Lymantria xylina multiple nucleopolyhedrovirus TaxID=2847840 RepID=D4N2F4_9ABAC|nr:ORF117 [Lymantria xylina nucleopolyhedrovirus]ADD73826.1 ORF117 [Lymantria xylina nucleopolyhedrovirus]